VTVAPQREPVSFDTLQDALAELRRRGLRVSTARRLVLAALFDAEGPVSALHLSQRLDVDPTSVYRNLEALELQGLVHHIHLGHGPGLYVRCLREEREYLYCESCAKVTPVAPRALDPVRRRLRDRFGYEISFAHFALVGLCASCAQGGGADEPAAVAPAERAAHQHGHDGAAAREGAAGGELHSHGDYVHAHKTPPRSRRRA
jgi:Fur family transcriptional regulator, ferric uptake regulator